ncbi:MAG: cobyrinic acid a,c-diamide synthase, partial [Pseudomonadota bacterium]
GLTQAREYDDLQDRIAAIARVVADSVDLAQIERLCPLVPTAPTPAQALPPLGQRIAVASDHAFAFAYEHLLAGWRNAGASLARFSPLAGEAPTPDADAVYLPGGYPELHGAQLAAKAPWREGLRRLADAGALIYGECGGYMALGRALVDKDGQRHQMAGLLPHSTSFQHPKRHLGYRTLHHNGSALSHWPGTLRGHEFHYASAMDEGPALFDAADAEGHERAALGTVLGRVAGSFAHVIDSADPLDDRRP